jgi:carboxymethylenebutenolidase
MGELVTFASNGDEAQGYLAVPGSGTGPGVVVIQEWWGLVPQIRRACDRLAAEGFTALAPDLYHGDIAKHDEMDKANELMSSLPMDRAVRDMSGAVDFLASHPHVRGDGIGVVGFCMGGMLTWLIACDRPDRVAAAVPYYGYPQGDGQPDWSRLEAAVEGHMAENDDFFGPEGARALQERLAEMGKSVELYFYPGTGHAFANEENALGTYDDESARQAWVRTLEFLREKLG